jgi:hypothetical protein
MATGVGRRTGDAGLRLLTCACRRGERASHTALPCQCSDANGRCEAGLLGVRCATAPALDPLTVRCASEAILIVASRASRSGGRAFFAATAEVAADSVLAAPDAAAQAGAVHGTRLQVGVERAKQQLLAGAGGPRR